MSDLSAITGLGLGPSGNSSGANELEKNFKLALIKFQRNGMNQDMAIKLRNEISQTGKLSAESLQLLKQFIAENPAVANAILSKFPDVAKALKESSDNAGISISNKPADSGNPDISLSEAVENLDPNSNSSVLRSSPRQTSDTNLQSDFVELGDLTTSIGSSGSINIGEKINSKVNSSLTPEIVETPPVPDNIQNEINAKLKNLVPQGTIVAYNFESGGVMVMHNSSPSFNTGRIEDVLADIYLEHPEIKGTGGQYPPLTRVDTTE
jgi:hypothetical protein